MGRADIDSCSEALEVLNAQELYNWVCAISSGTHYVKMTTLSYNAFSKLHPQYRHIVERRGLNVFVSGMREVATIWSVIQAEQVSRRLRGDDQSINS